MSEDNTVGGSSDESPTEHTATTSFEMKNWLDKEVVPFLAGPPTLRIYHPFWNGMPPKDVLVVLMAGDESKDNCTRCHQPKGQPHRGIDCASDGCIYGEKDFDPTAWPAAAKRLLANDGFRFDFTREAIAITHDGGIFNAFGGDGAPVFSPDGMASVRLFKKTDGIGLIAQVGCLFWKTDEHASSGIMAAAAVKGFFEQFDTENPMEVCAKYAVPFGQA